MCTSVLQFFRVIYWTDVQSYFVYICHTLCELKFEFIQEIKESYIILL